MFLKAFAKYNCYTIFSTTTAFLQGRACSKLNFFIISIKPLLKSVVIFRQKIKPKKIKPLCMKSKNLFLAIAAFTIAIGFGACSKDSSNSITSTNPSTEAQTQSSDQTFYTNETGYASDDANAAMNDFGGSYNARPAGVESPTPSLPFLCDTSDVVIDTTDNPHTITINYNGGSCGTLFDHKRTGSILLSFSPGFRWGTAGASLTITFNLKSVRISDNKTITITGTRTIVNTTGGLIKDLLPIATYDSVGYSITDNTTILFDNNTTRKWQASLHRTYTYTLANQGELTTTGSLTGTNRFGDSFSASITSPLVITGCSDYRYTSGVVSYTGGGGGTSTTTFGLTSSGTPIIGCVTGALYFNFVWSGPNGGSFTATGTY
jgi:hypothetical protein